MSWRGKLGVIVPSPNAVLEPEFYTLLPEGITCHFARVGRWSLQGVDIGTDVKGTDMMVDELPRASEELAELNPAVVAFGCTGGSFYKGAEYNRQLIDLISTAARTKATSTSEAIVDAIRFLGLKRISVLTPYQEWLSDRLRSFLAEHDVQVLQMQNLGMITGSGLGLESVVPQNAYQMVRELDGPDVDGILISCTAFRSIEILDPLERDLEKPVISSNQATLWKMLEIAGVRSSICGYGSLLERG